MSALCQKFSNLLGSLMIVAMCSSTPARGEEGRLASLLPTGRYQGYLIPLHKHYKLPITLDLLRNHDSKEAQNLAAIFKINLGSFNSTEYISHYYPLVSYSSENHQLILESHDQDLLVTEIFYQHGRLQGNFISTSAKVKGLLELQFLDKNNDDIALTKEPFFKNLPIFPTLNGEYEASCAGVVTKLQLEAAKILQTSPLVNNPFPGYRISGRLAKVNGVCGFKDFCLEKNYSDGVFNLYTGQLNLNGLPLGDSLQLSPGGALLDKCLLIKKNASLQLNKARRKSKNIPALLANHPLTFNLQKYAALGDKPKPEQLSGDYHGYLYHQATERYQRLRLLVKAIRHHEPNLQAELTYVILSAWLYFADSHNLEADYLAIDFKKKQYLDLFPNFIVEDKNDVLLVINSWKEGALAGLWYSKAFGLVGPFMVSGQDDMTPLVKADFIPAVTGSFKGPHWFAKLRSLGDNNIVEDEAKFYPIHILGSVLIPKLTSIKNIVRGSYDFYANSLNFELDDRRMIIGKVSSKGLSLFWPPLPAWGIILQPYVFSPYLKVASDS